MSGQQKVKKSLASPGPSLNLKTWVLYILLVLFLIGPYTISNNIVFFFLIPCLYLVYSGSKISSPYCLGAIVTSAFLILLPVILYNPFVYIIGVIIAIGFFLAFLYISKFLVNRFKGYILSLFAPCVVWAVLLYVVNIKSLLSSMFDVGVLFPTSAPLIWYAGSIGLTVLIILFNSAVAKYLAERDNLSLSVASAIAIIFIASFIFSSIKDPGYLYVKEKPVRVTLVQGGLPNRGLFGYKDNIQNRIKRYITLSSKAGYNNTDLVVWPEYTFPIDLVKRFPSAVQPVFDEIKRSGKTFIIGSLLDDPVKKSVHYDAALVIGGDGNIKETYYSNSPFVFSKGITPRKANDKLYIKDAGIVVCWEEFSPKVFRDYVNAGARYFITLLSDVDLDHSWFKKYVTFFPRARAAESMRYLARVTQTGITEVVSPFGKVLKSIPTDKEGYLTADIYKIEQKTFYSVHGDILTRIFLIFMICVFLVYNIAKKKVSL